MNKAKWFLFLLIISIGLANALTLAPTDQKIFYWNGTYQLALNQQFMNDSNMSTNISTSYALTGTTRTRYVFDNVTFTIPTNASQMSYKVNFSIGGYNNFSASDYLDYVLQLRGGSAVSNLLYCYRNSTGSKFPIAGITSSLVFQTTTIGTSRILETGTIPYGARQGNSLTLGTDLLGTCTETFNNLWFLFTPSSPNLNVTATFYEHYIDYVLDNTAPNTTLSNMNQSQILITTNRTYDFQITNFEDSVLNSAWYSLNGQTNITYCMIYNISGCDSGVQQDVIVTNLSAGFNNISFYTLNDAGALTQTNRGFYIESYPNVTLNLPINNSVINNATILNASFVEDNGLLKNATVYVWNSTVLYNKTTSIVTGGNNSTAITIPFSVSDSYKWNYYACNNDSICAFAQNNFSLIVDIANPIINQFPSTNYAFGIKNITVNCSVNGSNLDSMFLYGNFTGSYALNRTLKIGGSGLYNFSLILTDGDYLWTCAVNTTSVSKLTFSQQGNYTVSVDTTAPTVAISQVSTTAGSAIFSVTSTQTDPHLSTCKYSIYNSSSGIDGGNENISFTCNSVFIASSSGFGSFTLKVYGKDTLGYEGNNSAPFSIVQSTPSSGGGGGGGASTPPQPITNQTIAPNLEDNLFGFLSSSAFDYNGINVTWFVLGAFLIITFIIIYEYRHGGLKFTK